MEKYIYMDSYISAKNSTLKISDYLKHVPSNSIQSNSSNFLIEIAIDSKELNECEIGGVGRLKLDKMNDRQRRFLSRDWVDT